MVVDLTLQPAPAGQRLSRYSYPESYKPLHDGRKPAPTPIPELPVRKPARVLGDLRFVAPGAGLGGIALCPDGKRLALGTCIFNSATGELDAAYQATGGRVQRLAFSPDGALLYCGEGAGGNVPGGTALAVRDVPGKRHLLSVRSSEWGLSGDGRLLVTLESVFYNPYAGQSFQPAVAHFYPAVRIYDTATWKGVAAYRVHGQSPTAVALSPDGGRIVIGRGDGTLVVWDRMADRPTSMLTDLRVGATQHHVPAVRQLAFSPDGKLLAASNARQTGPDAPRQAAWWTWPDAELVHVKPVGRYQDPSDLRFSPDGKQLFCGLPDGAAVWDTRSGEARADLNHDRDKRTVPAVAFAAADRAYATGGSRPALLKFPSLDPVSWPERPFCDGPPELPFEVAGTVPPYDTREGRNTEIGLPDGTRLKVPPIFEGGVQLLDRAGTVVRHFEKGRVVGFDVTPDGKLLATYGHNADGQDFDRPLRLWDVATGKEAAAIRVYPRPDYSIRFSPDGKRMAVRHSDGLIRIWDVASHKPLLALDADGYWPARLTYSKDGRSLMGGAAGSATFVVWDVTEDKGD